MNQHISNPRVALRSTRGHVPTPLRGGMVTPRRFYHGPWWLLVRGFLVVVMVTIGCRPTPVNKPETQADNENASEVQTAEPRRAVNVVIFLIDTLRADYLHVYGYPQPTSPTMDALAATGVLFEQANAPAPWTLPTVASLMLSQFVAEHGVVYDRQRISPNADPIAARMRRAGCATASFLRNGYAGRMSGLDKGYDLCRMVSEQTDGPTIRPWLDRLGDQPFFLYIHNTEPHNPYEAVDRYLDQFGKLPPGTRHRFRLLSKDYRVLNRADFNGKQPLGSTDNTAEQREALARLDSMRAQVEIMYPATVFQADENLRSVIDELKRRGDLNVVVRQGMWKGIWNAEVGTFELYDLAGDPAESENLSVKEAERAGRMREFAESWLQTHQANAPTANRTDAGELDEETLRQLRTLGYVDDDEASDDEEPNEP